MSSNLRRIVLDVLKPHKPAIHELATRLNDVKGVEGINIALLEVDQDTSTVKITLEGVDIDFDEITQRLTEAGTVIHSIDEVVAGKRIVEKTPTYHGE
ncbi:MAG: DUF211 domain-containing protein [Candidatus Bathyarchaeota archaeon]